MTSTAYENPLDNTALRKLSRKISRIEIIRENSKNDEFSTGMEINNGASTSRENITRISNTIEEDTRHVSTTAENSNEKSSIKITENLENSNKENSNEQETAAVNNNTEITTAAATSNGSPEPNISLLERVRALESKITMQNQQLFGLTIALKLAKEETDDFIDAMVIPTCKSLSNVSMLTKALTKPINMTDMFFKRPADFIWTIKDIKEKLKNKEFEITSDEFQLSVFPNKAKAKLQLKADGWLYTSILIIHAAADADDPNTFKNANDVILPSLYCIFKNQHDGQSYDAVHPMSYLFDSQLDYTKYCYENKAFHKSNFDILLSKFVRNNVISVEFHLESQMTAYQVFTYNRTLNWAVDQYQHGRSVAKSIGQYVHCSPYFYCGLTGYRIRVHMMLNGGGEFKGKGLTAMVMFLTGEFDEGLPKEFLHRTTITLINQKHPDQNIVKSVEKNIGRDAEYAINLGTFKEIKKLIYKDILHYQVTVTPIVPVQ